MPVSQDVLNDISTAEHTLVDVLMIVGAVIPPMTPAWIAINIASRLIPVVAKSVKDAVDAADMHQQQNPPTGT